jgi:phage major head subunit gpT-like protein
MGALTPEFLANFETNITHEQENEYLALSAADNLWWDRVAKKRTTMTKKEIITFLFASARIRETNSAGHVPYEDIAAHYTEIETKYASAGFKITRDQLEDVQNGVVGGEAIDLGSEWATQIGGQMAYYPQEKVAEFIDNGESLTGYDGEPYFDTAHPLHPLAPENGTYANLHTSADFQITTSSTSDQILTALRKFFAHMATIKMPNGSQPRFLRPEAIICGPHLAPMISNALEAKIIASGNGSEDKTALVQKLGYALPVQADEFGDFDGYYVLAKQAATSKIGALIHMTRRPFEMRTFSPMTEVELSKIDEFDYQMKGKQAVAPGHPYLFHKIRAA